MIAFEFVNDRTGTDDAANYRLTVAVNGRTIAAGSVKGHDRSAHWTALLARTAKQFNYLSPRPFDAAVGHPGESRPPVHARDGFYLCTRELQIGEWALEADLAQVTAAHHHQLEQEAGSHVDTKATPVDSRTAPTNEAVDALTPEDVKE